MNARWLRSNIMLLALLAVAMVAVGALTALVIHQQHNQSAIHGQVYLGTTPAVDAAPKASAPAPAQIAANPNAAVEPNPATIPGDHVAAPADGLATPILPDTANAPAIPAPQVVPPPAPQTVTAPQAAQLNPAAPVVVLPRKPLQPKKTTPHRQVHPVPVPQRIAPVHPAAPAPVTGPAIQPATPASPPDSDQTSTKPGKESGSSKVTGPNKPFTPGVSPKPGVPAQMKPPVSAPTKTRTSRPSWIPHGFDIPDTPTTPKTTEPGSHTDAVAHPPR